VLHLAGGIASVHSKSPHSTSLAEMTFLDKPTLATEAYTGTG